MKPREAEDRPLLAKSYEGAGKASAPPRFALLLEHSRDVATCCKVLFDIVGDDGLRALGIGEDRRRSLLRALVASGWMQDVGKANSQFGQLVTTNPEITQLIRHEHVSGILFGVYPPLRDWILPLGEDLRAFALWGALGHHRKFHQDTRPTTGSMRVFLSHPEFQSILDEMAADVTLGPPPTIAADLTIVDARPARDQVSAARAFGELRRDFSGLENRFRADAPRRELALIKGLGIAADVAASALGRSAARSDAVGACVRELLDTNLSTDDIEGLIRRWAWREVANEHVDAPTERPPGLIIRGFQKAVEESRAMVTLAEAGCGSGKSLAAYLWAKEWSARRAAEHRPFRLVFCLPTTGTTTEHFKDYALECGVESSLAHSRAKVDLTFLAETASQEELSDGSGAAEAAQAILGATRAKIDALGLWATPLIVSTTDTVLGLMANARKPVCSLPAILQSAIIFDEIHAFDEVLFGHLLMFLKHFTGIPVLLMTASLPKARRDALQAVRPDIELVPGPEEQETRRRHIIRRCETPEPWEGIAAKLAVGERVLWVCNQVERANKRWEQARKRFAATSDVYLYHSRFKYKDRSRLHRKVIDAFKQPSRGVLLVATQVAEMSLNLSADLLVTDRSAIPSLIQRLGRHRRKDEGKGPGPVMVCELPDDRSAKAPYTEEDLGLVDAWLAGLVDRPEGVHQRDLAEAFAALGSGAPVDLDRAERTCGFIGYPGWEGLWRTAPGVTRADGYTVSVVFPSDLETCTALVRGEPTADWLREHEVSVTLRAGMEKWKRCAGVLIASDELVYEFDEVTLSGRGARWKGN